MTLIVLQRLLKVRGIWSVRGILRGCADHYDVLQRCNRPTITSSILMTKTNPDSVNPPHSLSVYESTSNSGHASSDKQPIHVCN